MERTSLTEIVVIIISLIVWWETLRWYLLFFVIILLVIIYFKIKEEIADRKKEKERIAEIERKLQEKREQRKINENNNSLLTTNMKEKLSDILKIISWREFSRIYFSRSSSWFNQKMNGTNSTGGVGGFTLEESKQLKEALLNLSERIKEAAEKI